MRPQDPIREIFGLAGWEPLRTATADAELLLVEQRIGRKLPLVFRRFVACSNSSDFLRRHSNSDQPVPTAELGAMTLWHWPGWESYDLSSENLLHFMVENQGVWSWAVELDTIDDPKVYVTLHETLPPSWALAANSFSVWLKCQVEDHQWGERLAFAANSGPLTVADLQLLRARFRERQQTFSFPRALNRRFSNAHCDLLLWCDDVGTDWFVSPTDGTDIPDVLNNLRGFTELPDQLYAINHDHEQLLRRWKTV